MDPEELENDDDVTAIAEALRDADNDQQAADTHSGTVSEQDDAIDVLGEDAATTESETAGEKTAEQEDASNTSKTQANPHKVLRAVRRSEQRLRSELDRTRAELEALKAKQPAQQEAAPTGSEDDLTEEELAELAQEIPAVAKLAKKLKQLEQSLPAGGTPEGEQASQQAATTDPEFEPPWLPTEVQDEVDEIPTLLEWQHSPDQSAFERAKAMDTYLRAHPKWAAKPMGERLKEVVRRIEEEDASASTTTTPSPAPAPRRQQIEARAARVLPATLSDIGGGNGSEQAESLSLRRMRSMNDSDLLAALANED